MSLLQRLQGPLCDAIMDRLLRLGVPLLLYTTPIINLNGFLLDRFYLGQPFQVCVGYTPGHLWFLQAPLVFAVVYVLSHGAMGGRARIHAAFDLNSGQIAQWQVICFNGVASYQKYHTAVGHR